MSSDEIMKYVRVIWINDANWNRYERDRDDPEPINLDVDRLIDYMEKITTENPEAFKGIDLQVRSSDYEEKHFNLIQTYIKLGFRSVSFQMDKSCDHIHCKVVGILNF